MCEQCAVLNAVMTMVIFAVFIGLTVLVLWTMEKKFKAAKDSSRNSKKAGSVKKYALPSGEEGTCAASGAPETGT